MRPPITLAIRFQQAGAILLVAALILWIGLAMLRAIGRSSPVRRRHGRFVLGWMMAGWLIGGAIGVCLIENNGLYPNETEAGLAGFGFLAGWVIGMVHGGLVIVLRPAKPAAPPSASIEPPKPGNDG